MPTPVIEVVDRLFIRIDELVPAALYPDHVLQIPGRINGTGFFPGGSGLYLEERNRDLVEFPFGGVMILGHNFDSESGFKKSLKRGRKICPVERGDP
jgi:hypothetical protein